jgi:hypothetical protein
MDSAVSSWHSHILNEHVGYCVRNARAEPLLVTQTRGLPNSCRLNHSQLTQEISESTCPGEK